jgi:hypothetical protein
MPWRNWRETMTDLRILIYTKGDLYIAQCLEHDICVQSNDVDEIRNLMARQFEYEKSKAGGLEAVPAAPDRFFSDWDRTDGEPQKVLINTVDNVFAKVSVDKLLVA